MALQLFSQFPQYLNKLRWPLLSCFNKHFKSYFLQPKKDFWAWRQSCWKEIFQHILGCCLWLPHSPLCRNVGAAVNEHSLDMLSLAHFPSPFCFLPQELKWMLNFSAQGVFRVVWISLQHSDNEGLMTEVHCVSGFLPFLSKGISSYLIKISQSVCDRIMSPSIWQRLWWNLRSRGQILIHWYTEQQ